MILISSSSLIGGLVVYMAQWIIGLGLQPVTCYVLFLFWMALTFRPNKDQPLAEWASYMAQERIKWNLATLALMSPAVIFKLILQQ